MADQNTIYFDSTYRLRVVEEEKFKDTERLSEECTNFTQSEQRAALHPVHQQQTRGRAITGSTACAKDTSCLPSIPLDRNYPQMPDGPQTPTLHCITVIWLHSLLLSHPLRRRETSELYPLGYRQKSTE